MERSERPKNSLIQEDIDELNTFIKNNKAYVFSSISERAIKGDEKSIYNGWRYPSVKFEDLQTWLIERFAVKRGRLGGQLVRLTNPLGPHADVIFSTDGHWTTKMKAVTQYFVIDTDSTTPLTTVVFDQSINNIGEYRGLRHAFDNGNVNDLADHPLGECESVSHISNDLKADPLSVQEILTTPKWEGFLWNSEQVHSGGTFPEGCTYKIHLTVQRPVEDYLKWYN